MKVQVGKWGNSLAVRLPKALTDEFGISEGDEIDVAALGSSLRDAAVVAQEERRRTALERIKSANWVLPPNWKIDRDDPDMRG